MQKLSYFHQPVLDHYNYETIPRALDALARHHPKKEAYIFRNEDSRDILTFEYVAEKSRALAAGLLRIGLKPDDRVVILGDPSPEWIFLAYATLRIKVIPIKTASFVVALDNLSDFLEHHQTKVLFINMEKCSLIQEKLPQIWKLLERQALGNDNSGSAIQMAVLLKKSETYKEALSLADLMTIGTEKEAALVQDIQDSIDPDDGAVVYTTSGSSGNPKLCLVSNFYLFETSRIMKLLNLTNTEHRLCFFNSRPFYWSASFIYTPVVCQWKYCHSDYFLKTNPEYAFDIINEERASTTMLGVATASRYMKEIGMSETLQNIFLAGEVISRPLINSIVDADKTAYVFYSSTEVGHGWQRFTCTMPEESPVLLQLYAGCEAKVVDLDTRMVPIGSPGILWFRSPRTMNCYLDMAEETAKKKTNRGWVNTEDVGILHPSGELQVFGRSSDVIMKGGVRIFPVSVEMMLKKHAKVQSVVVVGIVDEKYGQDMAACVIPKPGLEVTPEELLTHSEKHGFFDFHYGIAAYPTHFLILSKMPMFENGKPDKQAIRNLLSEQN